MAILEPTPSSTFDVDGKIVRLARVSCNYCGSAADEPLFSGPDRYFGLAGRFTIVRCRGCGLLRQNPQPTPDTIDAYYPPAYEPYAPPIESASRWWRRWDLRYGVRKRRRFIERYCKRGAILDVGCATGNFLAEMAKGNEWTVTGVEPNAEAAQAAIDRHGLDVKVGRISDVQLPDASFDVVTMWNVLEHLNRPIDDLRHVQRALKPGGYIVFSVPNLESYEVRLFRDRWFSWELPRHLYFFPRAVMIKILGELGFRAVDDVCLSSSQLAFAESVKYFYAEKTNPPRWNRVVASLIKSAPARAALFPVFYLVSALRQGAAVTYVARKLE